MNDGDLEERVASILERGGAAEAATATIEHYRARIEGHLQSMLDGDDARDAFSLWTEDVWKGLPGFRRQGSLRGWVFRVATHAAARIMRDPYRRRGERLGSSSASRLATTEAVSRLFPSGRHQAFERLLAAIDDDDRRLLELRVRQELEWEEIAFALGAEGEPVRSPALRKRYERLLKRLEQLARDMGLVE